MLTIAEGNFILSPGGPGTGTPSWQGVGSKLRIPDSTCRAKCKAGPTDAMISRPFGIVSGKGKTGAGRDEKTPRNL